MTLKKSELPGSGWENMEPGSTGWWIHEPTQVRVEIDEGEVQIYGPKERSKVEKFWISTQRAEFMRALKQRMGGGSVEGQRTRSGGVMHVKREPTKAVVKAAHQRRLARQRLKKNATVRKSGAKWMLRVGGKEAACFSTKREASDLAAVLNEMMLAQARKEVGL